MSVVELGDRIKDTITGFEGIAIGVTKWLNDCERWGIQSVALRENIPVETQWFDVNQLVLVEKGAVKPRSIATAKSEPSGGPMSDPPRSHSGP